MPINKVPTEKTGNVQTSTQSESQLSLKVGGKYRTRDGKIVTITRFDERDNYPFYGQGPNTGEISWMIDGSWCHGPQHPRDLVEEIVEEEPKKTLSLEVGKTYLTEGGQREFIRSKAEYGNDIVSFLSESGLLYRPDGTPFVEDVHKLVEEITIENTKPSLSLEVGKTYWTNKGGLEKIVKTRTIQNTTFFVSDTGRTYNMAGANFSDPFNSNSTFAYENLTHLEEEFQPRDEAFSAEASSDLIDTKELEDYRPNGFVKFDTKKVDFTYLLDFVPELEKICRRLEFGAEKYSRDNWLKGDEETYLKALLRHTLNIRNPDPDNGDEEEVAIIINSLFRMALRRMKGTGN